MVNLGRDYRAYVISRRCAKTVDLLWKYYGLQITDEIRQRVMRLSTEGGGRTRPQELAMLYLSEMLDEYEGDPHAPMIHASVEFFLRRANAAYARSHLHGADRFVGLREIAIRKYGWEP